MKVNLQMDWFGPNAKRYRARDNPNEIPEEFKPALPTSAKIVSEASAKPDVEAGAPQTPASVKLKI